LFSYQFNRQLGPETYINKQGNVNFTNYEESQKFSYMERELLFTAKAQISLKESFFNPVRYR